MNRVARLVDFSAPIKEGYFPKLDNAVASRAWPSRCANQRLKCINRNFKIDLEDLITWKARIMEAIHRGYVINKNKEQIDLTETDGIDIIGNLVEASDLSINQTFYGSLHNFGHLTIAYAHDPENRYLESFGVMGDTSTAMRDPIFYRWHATIDYIFESYKATLKPYTADQLTFPDITVQSISVQGNKTPLNELNTFWQQSDCDLSTGMDFQPRGPVFVRFTHLQHQDFTYTIEVNNAGYMKEGMCRIFLAPKFDERGNEWKYSDQKSMFIELDKFRVALKQGKNTITRSSLDSSITIPFERVYRTLETKRPTEGEELKKFNFCGCGWPHNMLLPRGRPEGMPCQLFVMITNYQDDKVDQDTSGPCNDAESFCGIRDKKYPDLKPMGYPFDRVPRDGVDTIHQFVTPNMKVQDISIRFYDQILKPMKKQ